MLIRPSFVYKSMSFFKSLLYFKNECSFMSIFLVLLWKKSGVVCTERQPQTVGTALAGLFLWPNLTICYIRATTVYKFFCLRSIIAYYDHSFKF